MNKHQLLPVIIKDGVEIKKEAEVVTKSILCETVLAIAKELIDSYKIFSKINYNRIGLSSIVIRVQKYLCSSSKFEFSILFTFSN